MQCVTFCRRSIVQYEHRSDWTLPQIVVQCENNGDSMILKIMQCELGIRDTIIKKKQPQIYQPTYIVKYQCAEQESYSLVWFHSLFVLIIALLQTILTKTFQLIPKKILN